jgi:hypothetical protein
VRRAFQTEQHLPRNIYRALRMLVAVRWIARRHYIPEVNLCSLRSRDARICEQMRASGFDEAAAKRIAAN